MKRTAIILLILSVLMPGASVYAEKGNPPTGPTKKDKCPVCGMFVYKYTDWVAAIRPQIGNVLYFDGPKDMFRHLRSSSFPVRDIWVTEYYNLGVVDAMKAFYVLGSDVFGPMGHELVPFASRKEAEEFMKDHKGKRILTFNEVTGSVLEGLK